MAILTTTSLGGEAQYAIVDHDPTTVATDLPIGSMILEQATRRLYQKLDDGASINIARLTQLRESIATEVDLTLSRPFRDVVVDVDATGGTVRVTLPLISEARPVSDAAFSTTVRKVAGAFDVEVLGQDGQLINADDSAILRTSNTALTFFPSAAQWGILDVVFPDPEIPETQTALLRSMLAQLERINLHLGLGSEISTEIF